MSTSKIEPPNWKPLLSVEHGGGTAAICEDKDGSFWLVHRLEDLDEEFEVEPEDDDETLDPREWFGEHLERDVTTGMSQTTDGVHVIGGYLPAGASRVAVHSPDAVVYETATSDNLWLAAAPSTILRVPSVSYSDSSGGPIGPELPDRVQLQRLAAADDRCPICDAKSWSFAHVDDDPADEDARFVDEWRPGERAMVCGQCGFRLHLPRVGGSQSRTVIRRPSAPASPEEIGRRDAARREHFLDMWNQIEAVAGSAPLGVSPWDGSRKYAGASGGRSGSYDGIHLEYSREGVNGEASSISVSTYALAQNDDPEVHDWTLRIDVARMAAGRRPDRYEYGTESELKEALKLRESELAASAQPFENCDIAVDGSPVDFRLLRLGKYWMATGTFGSTGIGLTVTDVDAAEIRLERTVAEDFS